MLASGSPTVVVSPMEPPLGEDLRSINEAAEQLTSIPVTEERINVAEERINATEARRYHGKHRSTVVWEKFTVGIFQVKKFMFKYFHLLKYFMC